MDSQKFAILYKIQLCSAKGIKLGWEEEQTGNPPGNRRDGLL